jgi:hypothetical protein
MLDADRGVSFEEGHGKVIEKTLSVQSDLDFRGVLGIVPFGGDGGTIGRTFQLMFSLAV